MARAGRFGGRRRASASNLTMLIASLMREQKQTEDRTAFDAWQNGGEFKGAKMDDARMLAYITERRDGFSTDDPLWDEWNNRLVQTKFSIGEQEIGTKFKQGKVSAGAVANWYRSQLKNIPKDSAFYRTVAGRAADWAKSAAASARAGASARANAAVQSKIDRIGNNITDAEGVLAQITKQAIRAGVLNPGETLDTGDATDIEDWLNSGAAQVNGKSVSMGDVRQATLDVYKNIGKLVPIYKQRGWSVKSLLDSRGDALERVTRINAIDDRGKYEEARDLWQERIKDANGDPYAIDAANQQYDKSLAGIYNAASAGDGTRETDAEFLSSIVGERNALRGDGSGTTPAALYGQTSKDDAATTAESALITGEQIAALNSGTAYWGQEKPGGGYAVILDPNGDRALDPSLQKTVVLSGGKSRVAYLRGKEVFASVLKGKDGNEIGLSAMTAPLAQYLREGYTLSPDDMPVGYQYDSPTGRRSWGVYDASGSLKFTDKNPFTSGVLPGSGSTLVVLGDAEGNAPVTGYISQGINSSAFSPLPGVDSRALTPDEVRAALLKTGDEGDAKKADEYGQWSSYMRTRDAGGFMGNEAPPTYKMPANPRDTMPYGTRGGTQSPITSALNSALSGIRLAVAPMFNPAAPKPPTAQYAGSIFQPKPPAVAPQTKQATPAAPPPKPPTAPKAPVTDPKEPLPYKPPPIPRPVYPTTKRRGLETI